MSKWFITPVPLAYTLLQKKGIFKNVAFAYGSWPMVIRHTVPGTIQTLYPTPAHDPNLYVYQNLEKIDRFILLGKKMRLSTCSAIFVLVPHGGKILREGAARTGASSTKFRQMG